MGFKVGNTLNRSLNHLTDISHWLWRSFYFEFSVFWVGKYPVDLLSVETESWSLLEFHITPLDLASVRVKLCMNVHVFYQVLFLGEGPIAYFALKLLQFQVDGHEVTFEAETGWELLTTVWNSADQTLWLCLLLLLKDSFEYGLIFPFKLVGIKVAICFGFGGSLVGRLHVQCQLATNGNIILGWICVHSC